MSPVTLGSACWGGRGIILKSGLGLVAVAGSCDHNTDASC